MVGFFLPHQCGKILLETPPSQNGDSGSGYLAGVDDGQDVFLGCWEKNGASCGLLL